MFGSQKSKMTKLDDWQLYCPICERLITAENKDDFEAGLHNGYIFIHDDKPHSDSDIDALNKGIQ